MYGGSKAMFELFEDRDVLVVVDESFGSDQGSPSARLCFMGRALYRRDYEHVSDLLSLLIEHDAADWHASRHDRRSLFTSPAYEPIVHAIERSTSVLLSMNRPEEPFRTEAIASEWNLRVVQSDLASAWTSNAPHAKALMAYTDRLRWWMRCTLPRGLKLRIVVDRPDWKRLPKNESTGLVELGATIDGGQTDIWALYDKGEQRARKFLPLLGLVDSELWASERLGKWRFANGDTARNRLERMRSEVYDDETAVTQEEFDQMRKDAPSRLVNYWDRHTTWWQAGRVIQLQEGADES
jgi:hypothetical protein